MRVLVLAAAIILVYSLSSCGGGGGGSSAAADPVAPPATVIGHSASDIPEILFDIPLGGIYDIGSHEGEDVGTLPVRTIKWTEDPADYGLPGPSRGLFFEPLTSNPAYPYLENQTNGHVETTFRLFVLPVIPDDASSRAEVDMDRLLWKVGAIQWYDPKSNDPEDRKYGWAINLCKSVAADLGIEPKVSDEPEYNTYQCDFANQERMLRIGSSGGKKIKLQYLDDVWLEIHDGVRTKIRKLEMDDTRPYRLLE